MLGLDATSLKYCNLVALWVYSLFWMYSKLETFTFKYSSAIILKSVVGYSYGVLPSRGLMHLRLKAYESLGKTIIMWLLVVLRMVGRFTMICCFECAQCTFKWWTHHLDATVMYHSESHNGTVSFMPTRLVFNHHIYEVYLKRCYRSVWIRLHYEYSIWIRLWIFNLSVSGFIEVSISELRKFVCLFVWQSSFITYSLNCSE